MTIQETPLTVAYHQAFGKPLADDDALFERLTIQVFQAGLNWRMVVNKLPILELAFTHFDVHQVATFSSGDEQQILQLAGMIRNRKKIHATIQNAIAIQQLQLTQAGFLNFLSQFSTPQVLSHEAQLNLGTKVAKQLHQLGFSFTGPETTRVFLASIGTWSR